MLVVGIKSKRWKSVTAKVMTATWQHPATFYAMGTSTT
jgi:hypothetical protein